MFCVIFDWFLVEQILCQFEVLNCDCWVGCNEMAEQTVRFPVAHVRLGSCEWKTVLASVLRVSVEVHTRSPALEPLKVWPMRGMRARPGGKWGRW